MNKLTKVFILIIVLIIIVIIIFFTSFTGNVVSSEKDTIKIGAIFPLTGKNAYLGEYMSQGMNLAKDEINSNGGINGKKLEIIYEDGQGDNSASISSYRSLVLNNIKFYFTTISGVTLAIAPIAEKDKNVLFNIASASQKISSAGDYIFRHGLNPEDEAKFLAKSIFNLGYKKIGIITSNAEGPIGATELFKKEYTALGGEVLFDERYEFGAKDYRDILNKVKGKNSKAILLSCYANEEGFLLKQAKELNFKPQWFGFYFSGDPKAIEIAQDGVDGLIFSHFYDANSKDILVQDYQKKYKERFRKESESFAALSYDGLYLISKAMKNCRDPEDATCVKDELYKIKNFQGITGKISFDKNGDTSKEIFLMTVKNRKFVRYEGGVSQ